MPHTRLAYVPLATYPDAVEDGAIKAAISFATSINCVPHATAFAVDLPRVSSGLGDLIIDIPGVIEAAEARSRTECERLQGLVRERASSPFEAHCTTRRAALGTLYDSAASEARYFDLAILPWSAEAGAVQEMAQAVVFGSGRPTILIPATTHPAPLEHIAIAWDGSRVAARALGDMLPLLAEGGHIHVLTVADEKPLDGSDLAGVLASWLERRGYAATAVKIALGKRTISEALQEAALSKGAGLLAMGGFGHSRIRDFILGGATKGVLTRVQLPILLSH